MQLKTMYEKIWDAHLVRSDAGEVPILYIDTHLVHEVTSPQAFEGLAARQPKGAPSGTHLRHDGPQCPHDRPDVTHRGSDCGGETDRNPRAKLRRV